MKKYPVILFTVLALSVSVGKAEEHESYPRGVLEKAGNGFANLISAPLEIPKNIINTTNQTNVIYGVFGGVMKGSINMAGRMGVGLVDLVTAPIPTKPITSPPLVWDDFDVDTHYGETLRLSNDE